jgi:hypothetical protein
LYYLAVTWDGTYRWYKTGIEEGNESVSGSLSQTAKEWQIGANGNDSNDFQGYIDEVRISSTARTAAWLKFTYYNINEADQELTWGDEEAASGSTYTLECDAGSYAITGTAMTPLHDKIVVAGVGTYAITGTAMSPLHGRKVSAGVGAYEITGIEASLLHDRVIACETGSIDITGTEAGLLLARKIAAAMGTYGITGTAMTPKHNKKLSAGAGSYIIDGTAVTLEYSGEGEVVIVYGSGWHMFMTMTLD